MKNELVSIIMPTYNCGKFIARTLDSVLEQVYENWELIIVDDCSTDNTDEVVAMFNDKRIKYLKNKKNMIRLCKITKNRTFINYRYFFIR